jgi:S1-C subfamily serine protease
MEVVLSKNPEAKVPAQTQSDVGARSESASQLEAFRAEKEKIGTATATRPESEFISVTSPPYPQGRLGPVTGLDGKVCQVQPKEGEVPILRPGDTKKGCTYSDDPADVNAYRVGQPRATRVNTGDGGHGSGVVVEREGDVCKVATDDHVDYPFRTVDVQMPNGKIYKGEPGDSDPGNDLNVIRVKMGDDVDACKPASVATSKSVRPGDKVYAVGFPKQTTTPYLQKGVVNESAPAHDLYPPDSLEDPERPMIRTTAPFLHGSSGEGINDEKGRLIGITQRINGVGLVVDQQTLWPLMHPE